MANVSKTSFDASKGYEKILFEQTGGVFDFDWVELQDRANDTRDRLLAQLADGAVLLGSGGFVKPTTSGLARRVDVTAGLAVHNGTVVRVPAVTDLQVINNATTTGQVQSLVYVEYLDSEIAPAADPTVNPTDPQLGLGHPRLKRTVTVKTVVGSTVLPAGTGGSKTFLLATITHDFAVVPSGVIPASGVAMAQSAVTPGELAGLGPARTLLLQSNAPAGQRGIVLTTRTPITNANLLDLANGGTIVVSVNAAGQVGILGQPTKPLDVFGAGRVRGTLDVDDNVALAATKTVDGIDLDVHDHSGGAKGVKIDHAGLLNLTVGDPHPQYLHKSVNSAAGAPLGAQVISAQPIFDVPGGGNAPFGIANHHAVNTVVNLNADLLDGYHAAAFALAADAAATYVPKTGATGLGAMAYTGRVTHGGNFFSTTATAGVLAVGDVPLGVLGQRALTIYVAVDPGTYTGSYDVTVFDGQGAGTVLAQWTAQSGTMIDRVPWYFLNSRTDGQVWVRVTKAAQTGTSHTFQVGLQAEQFA